nr:flagellar assembly peptidoglycan hydrolase FlgJ [Echinimonas agarilytica]
MPSEQALNQAGTFNDIASLDNLRSAAQKDEKGALREVALQFESIFMQMMLKGMREANAAFESDLFNSNYSKFYRDMSDQQMALSMSEQGALGLADVMIEQLSPETSKMTPASVLRNAESERPQSITLPSELNAISSRSSRLAEQTQPVQLTEQEALFSSPEDFVEKMLPLARQTAAALGVDEKAILAQAALETGWGQKVIRNSDGSNSFNLFNIKASGDWKGNQSRVSTLEFESGLPVKKMASFRSYEGFRDSFDDYREFIGNSSRYSDAVSKKDDSAGFLQELQRAGYATDPDYANKALSVLRKVAGIIDSK